MASLEQMELAQRTRLRNASLWINFDWGGLLEPLTAEQESLNLLHQGSVENFLLISDDAWDLKEAIRDRNTELDQAEIDQDRLLADEKVALGRARLAIRIATDDYVLAARVYDAKVKALIQGAREYAAQVELEQLAVEASRAELAVDREALRLKEINAKIFYEVVQRAQVEAEIARAQLDVAKAHVRVVMSEIEAGKAEIDLIEAEVQQAMAQADKATLQADVAMIFAEILTKKLSEIKLDVGRQEIEAGFAFLQTELADKLALWDIRVLSEEIREEAEKELLAELNLSQDAEKAQEDLRLADMAKDREVFDYEVSQTEDNLEDEKYLRAELVKWKILLAEASKVATLSQRDKSTWVEELLNAARIATYLHLRRDTRSSTYSYEHISGG